MEETVWRGSSALRPFLVPVDELEPYPGNPRRGDLAVVVESLTRFGQTRPILTYGERIVAGHHVRLAALELGWSHVAAIQNDFESDEEAQRFLLMDNRSHDRGEYELVELAAHLQALKETDAGLAGTGYEDSYLRSLERDIERWRTEAVAPNHFPTVDPDDMKTDYQCPHCMYEWSGSPRPNG